MQSNAIIIGACAGGFGSEVEGFLRSRGVIVQRWLDDLDTGLENIDDYDPKPNEQVIVCVADPKGREDVHRRLVARHAVFHGMLWHVGPHTHRIGGGCITMPYSVISAHADVGNFVHVNFHSTVGHHVKLGDYCTLSSHVDLTGHVEVGKRVFFGSGARVLPRVKIGDDAVIGAGAVVVSNVKPGETIYAPPGRVL